MTYGGTEVPLFIDTQVSLANITYTTLLIDYTVLQGTIAWWWHCYGMLLFLIILTTDHSELSPF